MVEETPKSETPISWVASLGLSKKTNVGMAAIATIGVIATGSGSDWIKLAAIGVITGLAFYGIRVQWLLDNKG